MTKIVRSCHKIERSCHNDPTITILENACSSTRISFVEGRKRSYKISFVAFWYETRLHCWYDHSAVRFTLDLFSCLLYSTFNKTIRRNQAIRSSSTKEKYDDAINRFVDFPEQKCYFVIWRITHINDSFLWLIMKNFKIQKLCQPRKLYNKVPIENSNWSLWSK